MHTEIPAVILDILSAIDAETASDTQTDERIAFCFIVKESEKVWHLFFLFIGISNFLTSTYMF